MGVKFHVASKGITGKNQIWRIYKNIDQTLNDTEYVESLEIEDTDAWTGESLYRIGYSLLVEGELTIVTNPETGLKHAIIHSGEDY